MKTFVGLLAGFRPPALSRRTLPESLPVHGRAPERLRVLWSHWQGSPSTSPRIAPTAAFAVIGQARADGKITPEQESSHLADLLTRWALDANLETGSESPPPSMAAPGQRPASRIQPSLTSGESYAIH